MDGIDINIFRLADHGIPYGFTPVLVANPETMRYALIPLPCAYPVHYKSCIPASLALVSSVEHQSTAPIIDADSTWSKSSSSHAGSVKAA